MLETYEEWRNRLATDILTCPECFAEDIKELGCEAEEGEAPHIEYFKCNECDHEFEIHNNQHNGER